MLIRHPCLALSLMGLLAGCQNTRVATRLPAVAASGYHHYSTRPAEPEPANAVASAETAPAATPHRVLTRVAVAHRIPPAAAAPDTTVTRSGANPALVGKPDPFTTAVNVTGAIGAAGGAILMAKAPADSRAEPGHMWPLVELILGAGLLLVGIALLLFQGENGRKRLARQARRATWQPAEPTVAAAPKPEVRKRRNLRLGLGLVLAGLVLGALPYILASSSLLLLAALLHLLAYPLLLAGGIVLLLALLNS